MTTYTVWYIVCTVHYMTQGTETDSLREEDKRNKRFYKISRDGKLVLKQLLAEWQGIGLSLDEILKESVHGTH